MQITFEQLRAAMLAWEQDHRDGKCRSHAEADALPIEQRADESAAAVWERLQQAGAA